MSGNNEVVHVHVRGSSIRESSGIIYELLAVSDSQQELTRVPRHLQPVPYPHSPLKWKIRHLHAMHKNLKGGTSCDALLDQRSKTLTL